MEVQGITPHLVVEGGPEAIAFYTKALGAVERYRMPSPDGKKLWHAELSIGSAKLMLADAFPEMGGNPGPKSLGGSPVVIHLTTDDCDALFAQAVEAGAEPVMPPEDMFWGSRYAKFTDPFGHTWSISTPKEHLTPEQMTERGKEAAAAMASKSCAEAGQLV